MFGYVWFGKSFFSLYEGLGDVLFWLLFGIVWKCNGFMFSFSDGWFED